MENNKKQQQPQPRSNKSSAEAQRKTSDLYVNNKSHNSRRREQLSTPRNEQQQRSAKQQLQQQPQQQQQPAKLRPNVDKRPRGRGGGGGGGGGNNNNNSGYDQESGNGDGFACTGTDNAYGGPGLAATGAGYLRSELDYELNSVYAHGSKKQNLNHLLNFHCVPRQSSSASDWHAAGHVANGTRRQPRFNKEQFLQANFQFVIRSGAKAQLNGSPDTLIDWNLIEQINIHTTEEPQCPICLYPPVAAKLTRCGHAYCWPCLLHYLSLSDKTWRKCPICYDAIHAADLKSCTIEQQHAMNVGDTISFELMRRRKGSIYIERYAGTAGVPLEPHERFPLLSAADEAKRFSKFLIAKRADIAAIIERERRELLAESDVSCPEDIFIQQALLTLHERCEKLGLDPDDPQQQQQQVQQQKQQFSQLQLVEEELPQAKTLDTEKPDDASVSSLGEASCSSNSCTNVSINMNNNNNSKYYYFYQSNDGQNIYLHPLNVKMLQACYGTLDLSPVLIKAQILQKEHHSMNEEQRRKFTCLGHLPLTCQFAVVEVELQPPIISSSILKLFKEDVLHRKKERQRREREERKREEHINEINDRQMGKIIASAANLNLTSSHEFPTCGFEEDLPAPRGALPIGQANGPRYSSVAASPKQELWPSIEGASSGNSSGVRHSLTESRVGAWGRAAPPEPVNVASTSRPTLDEDCELRAVGPWALGELLVGALGQQKQQRGGKSNTVPVDPAASKKQKKAKGKKMVPLFAVGMNRAP